jgi:hypothetical protein
VTGPSEKEIGRQTTNKARAALAEARQRAKDSPSDKKALKVFVTRVSGVSYGWEIRQFGGILLEKGLGSFATAAEAQADGGRVLASRFSATSDARTP